MNEAFATPSRLSGYYWRCACGEEVHAYSPSGIYVKRNMHRLHHEDRLKRMLAEGKA